MPRTSKTNCPEAFFRSKGGVEEPAEGGSCSSLLNGKFLSSICSNVRTYVVVDIFFLMLFWPVWPWIFGVLYVLACVPLNVLVNGNGLISIILGFLLGFSILCRFMLRTSMVFWYFGFLSLFWFPHVVHLKNKKDLLVYINFILNVW